MARPLRFVVAQKNAAPPPHAWLFAQGVRGCVANQAGYVFFGVPTHVVKQPIHLSGQLHIAFNVNRRLLALQHGLGQGHRRRLIHAQHQISRMAAGIGRDKLQQTCGGKAALKHLVTPANFDLATFLTLQTITCSRLLHEHMVEQEHHALLHFSHRPCGWRERLREICGKFGAQRVCCVG